MITFGIIWFSCAFVCASHYTYRCLVTSTHPRYDVSSQDWAIGVLWMIPAWWLYPVIISLDP